MIFKNLKKTYFKRRLKDTELALFEAEFKKFASLYEREKVRKQHDRLKEAIDKVKAMEDKKDDKERLEAELEKIEQQLSTIDTAIFGFEDTQLAAQPTADHPDPEFSLDARIQNYAEIRELLRVYLKENC